MTRSAILVLAIKLRSAAQMEQDSSVSRIRIVRLHASRVARRTAKFVRCPVAMVIAIQGSSVMMGMMRTVMDVPLPIAHSNASISVGMAKLIPVKSVIR
ncbi:hypothetical protein A2765_01240 [Candidatus Kaiserbacteria bacterium RIFCSPHIGHO2_01_FULL_56_24]|uniref:Uncharacterized protein n=1 Tax=Candidatus Kaiserbacteria bacterium RIFCSPHIGHO2_01_FULL_56_24 TaxID=1798487 RepID=A0A1F6DGC8_9BACT|nr:MAG: hypothetical protein A2765_01240 [Candidatus Kaiserbacteria bacterium RIFCSPHIGHO2_01_FULL_56_24]